MRPFLWVLLVGLASGQAQQTCNDPFAMGTFVRTDVGTPAAPARLNVQGMMAVKGNMNARGNIGGNPQILQGCMAKVVGENNKCSFVGGNFVFGQGSAACIQANGNVVVKQANINGMVRGGAGLTIENGQINGNVQINGRFAGAAYARPRQLTEQANVDVSNPNLFGMDDVLTALDKKLMSLPQLETVNAPTRQGMPLKVDIPQNMCDQNKQIVQYDFPVDALANTQSAMFSVPPQCRLVLRVRGAVTPGALRNKNFNYAGTSKQRVLFYFPDTADLTVINGQLTANVFAPKATLNLAGGGMVRGTVLVNAIQGAGGIEPYQLFKCVGCFDSILPDGKKEEPKGTPRPPDPTPPPPTPNPPPRPIQKPNKGNLCPWNYNVFATESIGSPSKPYSSDFQGAAIAVDDAYFQGFTLNWKETAVDLTEALIVGDDVGFKGGDIKKGGLQAGGDVQLNGMSVDGDVRIGGNLGGQGVTINGRTSLQGKNMAPANQMSFRGKLDVNERYNPMMDINELVEYEMQLTDKLGAQARPIKAKPNPQVSNNAELIIQTTECSQGWIVVEATAAQIAAANHIIIDVPKDCQTVIDVDDTTIDMGKSKRWEYKHGQDYRNTLINFPKATTIRVAGGDHRINILAPRADMTFTAGLITGNVIIKNINGNGQINDDFYMPCCEVQCFGNLVPIPNVGTVPQPPRIPVPANPLQPKPQDFPILKPSDTPIVAKTPTGQPLKTIPELGNGPRTYSATFTPNVDTSIVASRKETSVVETGANQPSINIQPDPKTGKPRVKFSVPTAKNPDNGCFPTETLQVGQTYQSTLEVTNDDMTGFIDGNIACYKKFTAGDQPFASGNGVPVYVPGANKAPSGATVREVNVRKGPAQMPVKPLPKSGTTVTVDPKVQCGTAPFDTQNPVLRVPKGAYKIQALGGAASDAPTGDDNFNFNVEVNTADGTPRQLTVPANPNSSNGKYTKAQLQGVVQQHFILVQVSRKNILAFHFPDTVCDDNRGELKVRVIPVSEPNKCTSAPTGGNGVVFNNDYNKANDCVEAQECMPTCDNGGLPSRISQCVDGQWTPVKCLQMNEVKCRGLPPSAADWMQHNNKYQGVWDDCPVSQAGDVCELMCPHPTTVQGGTAPTGRRGIVCTCDNNGNCGWEQPSIPLKCQGSGSSCGQLPNVANGVVANADTCKQAGDGQRCDITCNSGFSLVENPVCHNGKWSLGVCEKPAVYHCKCQSQYADQVTQYGPKCKTPISAPIRSFLLDLAQMRPEDELGEGNVEKDDTGLLRSDDSRWICMPWNGTLRPLPPGTTN